MVPYKIPTFPSLRPVTLTFCRKKGAGLYGFDLVVKNNEMRILFWIVQWALYAVACNLIRERQEDI